MPSSYKTAYQKWLVPLVTEGKMQKSKAEELLGFIESYLQALGPKELGPEEIKRSGELLSTYVEKVGEEVKNPAPFDYYHAAERKPFDYYRFGIDLIAPLVKIDECKRIGFSHLEEAEALLQKGENVIFIANHQIEPDPQVISLLLSPSWEKLAEKMIFVAGHRVLQDPLARPWSRGRNLLTIFSKKYIETPPEKKNEKLLHNQKTIAHLKSLLDQGGKAIYVAMSGGRDRPDEKGEIIPAAFDPNSLELFLLLAKEAKKKSHFFPLALSTYALFPPPDDLRKEIGEPRIVNRTSVHLAFGKKIDFSAMEFRELGKKKGREKRAEAATAIVRELYRLL